MPDIDIGWKVRLDELARQMSAAGQMTDASAKKAINNVINEYKKAERASAKAAQQAAREWDRGLSSIREGAKKALGTVGGMFGQLGTTVVELGEKLGGASSVLGTVGTVAAGAVVGVGAMSAAMVSIAGAADEAAKRLEDAGRAAEIPAYARESIEQYRDQTAALRTEVDLLTVSMGADLVSAVGDVSGRFALLVDNVAKAYDRLREFREEVESKVNPALRVIQAITSGGASELIRFSNSFVSAQEDLNTSINENNQALADNGKAYTDTATKAFEAAQGQERVTKATTAATSAVRSQRVEAQAAEADLSGMVATLEGLQTVADRLMLSVQDTASSVLSTMAASTAEGIGAIRDQLDSLDAEVQVTLREQAVMRAEAIGQTVTGFGDLAQAVADIAAQSSENMTEKQKQAAKRAFYGARALQIAQATIAGYTSAMSMLASPAFALLGPAGPAAAGATAVAATMASIAQIMSVSPPEFSRGGQVSPDHRVIATRSDEAVLTGRGVQALGGPRGVERANRGEGRREPTVVHLHVDGRRLATARTDGLGSLLSGRPMGRRPAYG